MIPQCYKRFQSLFYWITYSYNQKTQMELTINQLFQSLFYWITYSYSAWVHFEDLTMTGVSILILLDYLFLWGTRNYKDSTITRSFNPYFIGLPILIRSVEKALYLLLLQNFFQTLKSSFFRFF